MVSVLAPLLILAALVVLIAVGVFVAGRLRSGEAVAVSPRMILLAYLYVMSLAGLLTGAVGLSTGLKVGLAVPLGVEFSYYRPVAPAIPVPAPNGQTKPVSPVDTARAQAELERQRRQDVIQAATAIVVGLAVFVTHTLGRRRVGPSLPAIDGLLRRGDTTLLLAVFGIGGLISLIMGIQDLLQFWLLPAVDEFSYRSPPGSSVATAIVFVPLWLYYLQALVRQSRDHQEA